MKKFLSDGSIIISPEMEVIEKFQIWERTYAMGMDMVTFFKT